MRLILASSSRYRKTLLERLSVRFSCSSPDIDESRHDGESAEALVVRLAEEKAAAIATQQPNCVVIGSDQLAELDGDVLGKAGSIPAAEAQLARLSGRSVRFLTAVCVLSADGSSQLHLDVTEVQMRDLRADEIARYVAIEQPLDCAGSFKSEGLGAALFDAVHSTDPSALIGLPLIATARMLRAAGIDPLGAAAADASAV